MTDANTTEASTDESGLSRRTIVRTAGKAAWAAPVIAVASAAPAYAASPPAALSVLITNNPLTNARSGNTVTVNAQITNLGGGTTGFAVRVDVFPTVTTGSGFDQSSSASATTATGFTAPTKAGTPTDTKGVTFNFPATSQLPGVAGAPNNVRTFSTTVTITNGAAGTFRVTAIAGGAGTNGSATRTFI